MSGAVLRTAVHRQIKKQLILQSACMGGAWTGKQVTLRPGGSRGMGTASGEIRTSPETCSGGHKEAKSRNS